MKTEQKAEYMRREKPGNCFACGKPMIAGESMLIKTFVHFGCWQSANYDKKLNRKALLAKDVAFVLK